MLILILQHKSGQRRGATQTLAVLYTFAKASNKYPPAMPVDIYDIDIGIGIGTKLYYIILV